MLFEQLFQSTLLGMTIVTTLWAIVINLDMVVVRNFTDAAYPALISAVAAAPIFLILYATLYVKGMHHNIPSMIGIVFTDWKMFAANLLGATGLIAATYCYFRALIANSDGALVESFMGLNVIIVVLVDLFIYGIVIQSNTVFSVGLVALGGVIFSFIKNIKGIVPSLCSALAFGVHVVAQGYVHDRTPYSFHENLTVFVFWFSVIGIASCVWPYLFSKSHEEEKEGIITASNLFSRKTIGVFMIIETLSLTADAATQYLGMISGEMSAIIAVTFVPFMIMIVAIVFRPFSDGINLSKVWSGLSQKAWGVTFIFLGTLWYLSPVQFESSVRTTVANFSQEMNQGLDQDIGGGAAHQEMIDYCNDLQSREDFDYAKTCSNYVTQSESERSLLQSFTAWFVDVLTAVMNFLFREEPLDMELVVETVSEWQSQQVNTDEEIIPKDLLVQKSTETFDRQAASIDALQSCVSRACLIKTVEELSFYSDECRHRYNNLRMQTRNRLQSVREDDVAVYISGNLIVSDLTALVSVCEAMLVSRTLPDDGENVAAQYSDVEIVCPSKGRQYQTALSRKDVESVQLRLAAYRSHSPDTKIDMRVSLSDIDGRYGKGTCRAIAQFEIAEELSVSGSLDQSFYDTMMAYAIDTSAQRATLQSLRAAKQMRERERQQKRESSKQKAKRQAPSNPFKRIGFCAKAENADVKGCERTPAKSDIDKR